MALRLDAAPAVNPNPAHRASDLLPCPALLRIYDDCGALLPAGSLISAMSVDGRAADVLWRLPPGQCDGRPPGPQGHVVPEGHGLHVLQGVWYGMMITSAVVVAVSLFVRHVLLVLLVSCAAPLFVLYAIQQCQGATLQ